PPRGQTWGNSFLQDCPPRGQTWGNSFLQDSHLQVRRGEWICLETMVQMNDVGQSNGELALWINGQLVSQLGPGYPLGKWTFDKFIPNQGGEGVRWNHELNRRESYRTAPSGDPFEGFRFRTNEALNVNFLWLYVYLTKGSQGHVNRVWFDDVVVAKEYIGPLESSPRALR
ncbi:MAG: hypothetical protein KDA61_17395, partial [Planctomycetales bacterium]|nr:hypothetical protein [Planctomycetales bacterium]